MPEELDKIHKGVMENLKGKINPQTKKPYSEDEIWAIAQEQYKKVSSKEMHDDEEMGECPECKKKIEKDKMKGHMKEKHGKDMPSMEKKDIFYSPSLIELKEENGEFYSSGFVATSHPDRSSQGKYKGDILTKNALGKIVEQINSRSNMMADLVSNHHDWIRESNPSISPAGRAINAELRQIDNNHWGAFVKTHHNKMNPEHDKIKYEVEKGYIPGYSIEYVAKKTADAGLSDGTYRVIDDLELKGYGFASGRLIANPHAVITDFNYKEIENIDFQKHDIKENGEVNKMESNVEVKEKIEVDMKEYEKYKKFLEMEVKERAKEDLKAAVKEAMMSVMPEMKIKLNDTASDNPLNASIEFKEYSEIKNDNISIKEAFNRATALATKVNAFGRMSHGRAYEFKTNGIFNEKIEVKAPLTTITNTTTDTDYLQNAAELSDIYAPAIAKMLNQKTTYWGILPKEDWSGKSLIEWRAENVANASAAAYAEGAAIVKGQTTRQKLLEHFKYYQVGVQVTGQMIEASRSGVGDIFQHEIEAATRALLSVMNTALFAEVGAFTATGFLGLEYISDSTGNTTLYGFTRSATNLLGASGSEYSAQSSAPISKATLRTAIRTLEINGTDRNDLVIVCHPLQRDLILQLLDPAQRYNATSARAGFEGQLAFEGVPLFADKDANNDDIYVVNTGVNGLRMAVQKPVTYTDLAVVDDSRSGFLKFYGNQYAPAPKQAVYMIQGLSTS